MKIGLRSLYYEIKEDRDSGSILFYKDSDLINELIVDRKSRIIKYFKFKINSSFYELVDHTTFKYKFCLYKGSKKIMSLTEDKFFAFQKNFTITLNSKTQKIRLNSSSVLIDSFGFKLVENTNTYRLYFDKVNEIEALFVSASFILMMDVCSRSASD